MLHERSIPMAALLAAAAALAPPAGAAEMRLRDRCEVAGAVVTLGDVAEIFAADADQSRTLEATELFPAPAAGQRRYVRQREIEDLLVLRGVNTALHRFSGAGQVEIVRAGQQDRGESRVTTSVARRAERLVREAIVRRLQAAASRDEPWHVQVQIDEAAAAAISLAGDRLTASGGSPPWTGEQQFEVAFDGAQGRVVLPIRAQVALPPAVVVAVRAIPRGSVVQAADVTLERGATAEGDAGVFHALADVVGSETTRAIPAGKPVEQGFVRSPILVRRGQVVTVHARASGIHVRTTARARDDGGLGDLISVESLLDRKAFFVRVCGIQEAEVYARAVQAARGGLDGDASGGTERR